MKVAVFGATGSRRNGSPAAAFGRARGRRGLTRSAAGRAATSAGSRPTRPPRTMSRGPSTARRSSTTSSTPSAPRLRAPGSCGRAERRRRRGARGRRAVRLSRWARRRQPHRLVASPKQARDRRMPGLRSDPGHDAACCDGRRQGQRGLRDHRRPRRPAAGDDHAQLGLDPDSADRARRHRPLPRRRLWERGHAGARFRCRRARGDDLPADDRAHRGPAGPTTADRRGAGADAEAVLALAPSRHPGRRLGRSATHRGAEEPDRRAGGTASQPLPFELTTFDAAASEAFAAA